MAYCDYCGFEIGKECDCPTPMPRPEKPLHRKPDDPVLYCDNCTKPIPDEAVFCIVQDNISDWFCTARCQKEWAQLIWAFRPVCGFGVPAGIQRVWKGRELGHGLLRLLRL